MTSPLPGMFTDESSAPRPTSEIKPFVHGKLEPEEATDFYRAVLAVRGIGLAIALRTTLLYRPGRAALVLVLVPVALLGALAAGLGLLGTILLGFFVAPVLGLVAALAHGQRLLARHRARRSLAEESPTAD